MSVSAGLVCRDHLGSFNLTVMTGPAPRNPECSQGGSVNLQAGHVTGHSRDLELSPQLQLAVFFLGLVLLLLFT